MLLSKSCTYAVRAALLISKKKIDSGRNYIPVSELAKELDISFHFLTKILQKLTESKIMNSFRGPNGGITLTRSPEKIKIIEIVDAIDGMKLFESCIFGLPTCSDDHPCPLHKQWKLQRIEILKLFKTNTIHDLTINDDEFNLSGK
ncbi:MAG: Rrf2 family transcriptional regulator [Calditrichaeota bacterium]|nr:MAG: Rrf2 family transcriptional regulator [Calditrichota bacterium]